MHNYLVVMISEVKQILLSPKEYFGKMPKEGGFEEPVKRVIIYSLLYSLILLTVNALFLRFVISISIITLLISTVVYFLIYALLAAVILMLLSGFSKGCSNYETNFRVVSALAAVSLISPVISATSSISIVLYTLLSLPYIFYSLWVLNTAIINALGADIVRTKKILIALFIIRIVLLLFSIKAIMFINRQTANLDHLQKSLQNTMMNRENSTDDNDAEKMALYEEHMKNLSEEDIKRYQELGQALKSVINND